MITLNVLRCLSPWVDYLVPKPHRAEACRTRAGDDGDG